jgi:hypothetical protein
MDVREIFFLRKSGSIKLRYEDQEIAAMYIWHANFEEGVCAAQWGMLSIFLAWVAGWFIIWPEIKLACVSLNLMPLLMTRPLDIPLGMRWLHLKIEKEGWKDNFSICYDLHPCYRRMAFIWMWGFYQKARCPLCRCHGGRTLLTGLPGLPEAMTLHGCQPGLGTCVAQCCLLWSISVEGRRNCRTGWQPTYLWGLKRGVAKTPGRHYGCIRNQITRDFLK